MSRDSYKMTPCSDRPTTEQLRAELERISSKSHRGRRADRREQREVRKDRREDRREQRREQCEDRREQRRERKEIRRGHGKGFLRFLLILILLIAILIAAVVLIFPAFVVYGNSMAPALHEGDLVLAASDPFPGIGDLIAFRSGERVLIKRVIGCPGDSVEVQSDGSVLVNEERLSEPWALLTGDAAGELDYPVIIPEGGYFVLGDNRGSSVDSRYRVLGIVDESQLIGRLVIRLWPLNRIELLAPDAFQALLNSVNLNLPFGW